MNDYIDQLIKEAEELEKDYYAGAKYGRHMDCALFGRQSEPVFV